VANIHAVREEQAADERNPPKLREVSSDDAAAKYDPTEALRESLRKPAAGETQEQGLLARIDCDTKGITFSVRINGRLLKLKTDSFTHVELMSFSPDAGGEITCGLRKPENNVVIAYVPTTSSGAKTDGVLKSLEFVPPEFKLKAAP
jgi:hypothetical protein